MENEIDGGDDDRERTSLLVAPAHVVFYDCMTYTILCICYDIRYVACKLRYDIIYTIVGLCYVIEQCYGLMLFGA